MNQITEISIIQIDESQAPSLYTPNGLDAFLEQIRNEVNEVPDLSTKKGRDRVASLAAKVSRSKTAIEKPGRDYLRRLKEAVKPAEAEIKRFVDACDSLRDDVRRPLTEWQEEQDRIAAEKAAAEEKLRIEAEQAAAAEALKKQVETDHELALLLNDKFDRDAAEARAEAERQRIEREEEMKRQAAEQARREAEEAAQREREAAAQREVALKAQAEQAERDRIAAQERAEREAKEAAEKAERQRIEAQQRADREKQEAIDAERRKAAEAEAARMAEEKRIADEAAARAADKEHRRKINGSAKMALVSLGISEDLAQLAVAAIARGEIPMVTIKY